jgi:hypothetical protein
MKLHEGEHLELDHLRDELHQLELRVKALEHRPEPLAALTTEVPSASVPNFALPFAPNAIPAAGRAILGLAGAFLLRALAESGSVPLLLVVTGAILYAAAWLVFSVRTREQDSFASTAYGVTAAFILAPLLWEATVRFHVLPPPAAAGILVAFLGLCSALSWSKASGAVTTVTILSTLVTAAVLMVQTGSLVPFGATLLAIAAVVEVIDLHRHQSMRAPVALAADFAVWLMLFVMTRPTGVPQNYTPVSVPVGVALCASLFLIYGVGIVWRTVALNRVITAFEIVQSVAAFVLAAGGAFELTQGGAAPAVGALCAIACGACYFTAFLRFPDAPRNHTVFAAWGAALGLLACVLILPQSQVILIWSAAATLATLAGAKTSHQTLSITLSTHGAVYLLAAGLISGLPHILINAFTGEVLEPANPALWIMAIASICCYAAWGWTPAKVSTVPALFAALSIAALVILVARPAPSLLPTARTLTICALALAFCFMGSRTRRRELVWISYAAIALGTVKLIMEDFRQSHPAALAVSLLCYGALLILVPKLSAKPSSR